MRCIEHSYDYAEGANPDISGHGMSAFPKATDQGWRRRVRSRVLRWYDQNGRTLPWRETSDPYRIWISEIMLQQTTVAAVVPYFERFVHAFPQIEALAAADQESVLKLWEGLGYYSRARNIHRTAKVIVNEHNGQFPETAEELRRLPGIGPYTAGAIASFAFNEASPILEANTLRLFSRLIELDTDPQASAGNKLLWKFAAWIVSRKRPADFNQAVMDIGSQVCRPEDPDCLHCPLMASCRAFESERQNEIPVKKRKPKITDVTEISIALLNNDRFLLRQRTESERWAGMWDFIRFAVNAADASAIPFPSKKKSRNTSAHEQKSLFEDVPLRHPLPAGVRQELLQRSGLDIADCHPRIDFRHVVTRYRIHLLCISCNVTDEAIGRSPDLEWFSTDELADLPLSTSSRRFAKLLVGEEQTQRG